MRVLSFDQASAKSGFALYDDGKLVDHGVIAVKEKVCCFTGHRKMYMSDFEVRSRLEELLDVLISKGVIYYGCGGALGFDTIAAKCVIRARSKNPKVKLILVLPCKDQDKMWSDEDK